MDAIMYQYTVALIESLPLRSGGAINVQDARAEWDKGAGKTATRFCCVVGPGSTSRTCTRTRPTQCFENAMQKQANGLRLNSGLDLLTNSLRRGASTRADAASDARERITVQKGQHGVVWCGTKWRGMVCKEWCCSLMIIKTRSDHETIH